MMFKVIKTCNSQFLTVIKNSKISRREPPVCLKKSTEQPIINIWTSWIFIYFFPYLVRKIFPNLVY